MPVTLSHRGVSLIELLAAVVLISIVVASLSLFFPQSSRALVANRQHAAAGQMAQDLMQAAKSTQYDLLTPSSCDCSANFTPQQGSNTTTVNSVSFKQETCVDFVDHASLLPPGVGCTFPGTDDGLKRITVQVTWNYGADASGNPIPHATTLQSVVSRL